MPWGCAKHRLGNLVAKGHKIWKWHYDPENSQLYNIWGASMDVYVPPQGEGQTQCPNRWSCAHRDQPRVDMGAICTVRDAEGGDKAIICHANEPQVPSSPLDFWEVLRKWQRTWMWDNLQWVEDDDWLLTAIAEGTCIAVTDGSYMKDLYPNINLAAVVLECSWGRGRIWCSFPEASHVACSYHGELVGLREIHLILGQSGPDRIGSYLLRLPGGTGEGQKTTPLKGAFKPGSLGHSEEYSGQLQQPNLWTVVLPCISWTIATCLGPCS